MIDIMFAKLALILVNLSIVGCILFLVYQAIKSQLKLEASYPENIAPDSLSLDDYEDDDNDYETAKPYDYMIARKEKIIT